MGMQKKNKVSKTKSKPAKPAKSGKTAAPSKVKAKPVAKKLEKKVEAKSKKPIEKAPTKAAVKPTEITVKEIQKPVESKALNHHTAITKEEFKNMSADAQEHYKKWLKLQKQMAVEKAMDYKMTDDFEIKTPISHKVHGWGVVVQKRDNYIDVLFEAGLKTLIVNYKP